MADEITFIPDDDGLAVLGDQAAVERFLDSAGLLSRSKELPLDRVVRTLDLGANVANAASGVAETSGRYVQLTKESAQRVRDLGLMKTKTPGVSHAMLGEPGSITGWLQVEDGAGSLLTNPALLSGVGGLMAQFAREAEVAELKALLLKIDDKLDDIRRAQRDRVLAKLHRAGDAIAAAMAIREHGGSTETAWGKVEAESGTIAEVQGAALLALDALADKVQVKDKVGKLADATRDLQFEVAVWLAVLARCFQLQDEFEVLEIDHVLNVTPAKLDGHCLGLRAMRQERRAEIVGKTKRLIARMERAGAFADSNVVLHPRAAPSVVGSVNSASAIVGEFRALLGVESVGDPIETTPWWEAIQDPEQLKNARAEARPVVEKVVTATAVVVVAFVTKGKFKKKL